MSQSRALGESRTFLPQITLGDGVADAIGPGESSGADVHNLLPEEVARQINMPALYRGFDKGNNLPITRKNRAQVIESI